MKNILCFIALVGYFLFLNNQLLANPNNSLEPENSTIKSNTEYFNNSSKNSTAKYIINQPRQFDFSENEICTKESLLNSSALYIDSEYEISEDSAL